jgi:hypothetical protein
LTNPSRVDRLVKRSRGKPLSERTEPRQINSLRELKVRAKNPVKNKSD